MECLLNKYKEMDKGPPREHIYFQVLATPYQTPIPLQDKAGRGQ